MARTTDGVAVADASGTVAVGRAVDYSLGRAGSLGQVSGESVSHWSSTTKVLEMAQLAAASAQISRIEF
jgi:hypothetical protein